MLKLSNNSKTKFSKNHKNTFGLLHGRPENGGTCVGSTCGAGGCLDVRDGKNRKTCYVEKIVQIYKQVGATLLQNTNELVGKSKDEMLDVLRRTINTFVSKSKDDQLFFRLHWAGDFFSLEYAEAWAEVMREFPQVRFWTYTRSFRSGENFIEPLLTVDNLTLYLSCDPDNYEDAKALFDKHSQDSPRLGLAWLGLDAPEQDELRWVVCPETSGKVKNTEDSGACSRCRLCVDNFKIRVKNIKFKIH